MDRDAFRERTLPIYDDPEFAEPAVQDLIRRIRAVGLEPKPEEAS